MTFTLGALAVRFGCELEGDPDIEVDAVATLQNAAPRTITFLANPKYRKYLAATRAAAVILDPKLAAECPVPALVSPNPYALYARIATLLHPEPCFAPGIHARAVVDSEAAVEASASVAAGAIIERGARVGARARIGPGSVVMEGATVGEDTRLAANVTLYRGVSVGARCLLHAGVVIGADGFGIAPDRGGWVKVPQIGSVSVGNDVEIGANTTIDRGALRDTVIGEGSKIDNLVQIGHNVVIGRHCVIVAQTGISGSAELGDFVVLGGQVGVVGHVKIGAGAQIAASSNVRGDVPPGVRWGGTPAKPVRLWFRELTLLQKLAERKDLSLDRDEDGRESD
jgi:UDP-3-O-[3-hydroxymyristoyl] glucosamine N-acyltransferase